MADETFLAQVKRLIVGAPIPHTLHTAKLFPRHGARCAVPSESAVNRSPTRPKKSCECSHIGGVAALGLVTPIGRGHRYDAGDLVFSYRQTNLRVSERRRSVHRRERHWVACRASLRRRPC